MANKNKLTIDELKSLCNKTGEKYISKEGNDYVLALDNLFGLVNRNDTPFSLEDIASQPLLSEFTFEGIADFKYICELKAKPMTIIENTRTNEKIEASNFADDQMKTVFKKSLGVAYIITCSIDDKEHIIKIGQSRTPFEKRLGSYNCGTAYNWRTASTTNIKMLQSMVATRQTFKLYIYDCSDEPYTLQWHGETSIKFASPKSLAVEDILVKKFAKVFNGRKPLANVQTNATEAD